MSEYVDFHYMPLEGRITGKQVLQQTEDAINDLGNKVYNLNVDEERIDEAIENSEQAINTANSALSAVTTDRAVWKNTVAEMKATDIDLGVTAATRGKNLYNDGDGAFYVVRQEKSGDIDGEDTVFLDNGNVAERLKQFNFIAKGNNIIYVENVASLREADAVIGNVYGTTGYYSANDGGASVYTIRAKIGSDVDDGGSIIFLDNGNVAELITDGTANVKQFGAVGDGVTDDTQAIQNAVNFAQKLFFPKSTYVSSTISVTKNITIDFGFSDFILVSGTETFFNCTGKVNATLENEANYTYSDETYRLTEAGYTDYTGFAMLQGDNNFEKARDYYLGGFVCEFYDGLISTAYPVDVTNPVVLLITPITVEFYNCGEIIRDSTDALQKQMNFYVTYGLNCVFSNFSSYESNAYGYFYLRACLNCHLDRLNIQQNYPTSNNNSYIVAFIHSSFCILTNSYLYNKLWHCVTTGGQYLTYHNAIKNCKLVGNFAFGQHENEYMTIIEDSVFTSSNFAGGARIKNCTVIPANGIINLKIDFVLSSDIRHANYIADKVRFVKGTGTVTQDLLGFRFTEYAETSGNTYYCDSILIKDCSIDSSDATETLGLTAVYRSADNFVIKNITVVNSPVTSRAFKTSSQTNVDISKYVLSYENCTDANRVPVIRVGSGGNGVYNDLRFNNCTIYTISGSVANLTFHGLKFTGNQSTGMQVSGSIIGTGLITPISPSALLVASVVRISDMTLNSEYLFNITKQSSGLYCTKFDTGTSQYVTYQLA